MATSYRTLDGRVRVLSTTARGEWHRHTNRRGAKVTLWHAYNVPENRWIGRDHFTLGSIKRLLVSLGYCAKEADCQLKRERS
jgi:hypothetical protein